MEMQALGLAGVAAVIAAVALIQRSETRLRLLVAVAALFAGTAAWLLGARGEGFVAAAASFGLIGLAGLIGYAMRRWELAPVSISRRHRHVLDAMGSLEPRLFRDLMKCAELRTADIPLRLTKEGRRPEKLWFVISGDVRISKLGQEARLKGARWNQSG